MKFALRMLRKQPGFSLAAICVLALGIRANTAIFALVNAFLLRPLVLRNPQELTGVYSRSNRQTSPSDPSPYRAFSYPEYADLRSSTGVFAGLAAHNMAIVGLAEGDTTRRVMADIVSSNFFDTLGAPVARGRAFMAAEERPDSAIPVAIVSYRFWKSRGASPDFLGSTLRINGQVLTVVGIAAEGFTGTTALVSPELYLPLGMFGRVNNDFDGPVRSLAARDNYSLIAIGRLLPALAPAEADRRLAARAEKDRTLLVRPLSRLSISTDPTDDSQLLVPATLLLAMAAVVLLIAALNVTNMMLARGAARRKEIALRLALGGGRSAILRQLFLEGLLLAGLGGIAGLGLSYAGNLFFVESMLRLVPFDLFIPTAPDIRVLAATTAFCLLATVVFALLPAWKLSRPSLVSDLRSTGHAELPGGRRRFFTRRNILVVAQVSLSLTLLTAAGLFLRSSQRVAGADPGFHLDNQIAVEFDAGLAGYGEARARQVYRAVLDRARSLPGVESASFATTIPFGMVRLGRTFEAPGSPRQVVCRFNPVGPDYFRTLGIPLVRGRAFAEGETGVAVLDSQAAQLLWPGADPIGRRVHMRGTDAADLLVVGIAGAVRERFVGMGEEAHVYTPLVQTYQSNVHLHLRTARLGPQATSRLLIDLRREIRATDPNLPVLALGTLRDHMDASIDYWVVRMGARMFAVFGAIALLLAMIGLYGVRAYSVALRTREIGIRMALGSSAGSASRMVLGEGLRLMAAGAAIGLALSLLLGKLLAGLLFQVSAADPVVFSAATVLLAAVSLAACYFRPAAPPASRRLRRCGTSEVPCYTNYLRSNAETYFSTE